MKPDPHALIVVEFDAAANSETAEDTVLEEPDDESKSDARLQRSVPVSLPGVVIGKVMGWDSSGYPLVDYPRNSSGEFLPARVLAPLDHPAIGLEVALMFIEGDPRQPLVIGQFRPPEDAPAAEASQLVAAEDDGDRLVFTAEKEIVLRCGKASITLTRAGKVLIRGAYLLSRSSGVNRIKGGSVQIN